MEEKKKSFSFGLVFLSIYCLFLGISSASVLSFLQKPLVGLPKDLNPIAELIVFSTLALGYSLVIASLFILLGGFLILLRKEPLRKLLKYSYVVLLLLSLVMGCIAFPAMPEPKGIILSLLISFFAISLGWPIIYLSNPKVKEQFN